MKPSIITFALYLVSILALSAQCPVDLMTEFYWEQSNGDGATWDSNDVSKSYNFGPVDVNVKLIDEHNQNIDADNAGTSLNVLTKTMGSYGENYLTLGMTSENSEQEVAFEFNFSEPVFLNNFEISDIDFVGYAYYNTNRANQSYQDEVHVIASLDGIEVPISIRPATDIDSKVTIDATAQSVVATYGSKENGNIAADDDKGKVFLTGATAIDYFKVIYSNGPNDAQSEQQAGAGNGKSDDHAIRLGTFYHCSQKEALPVEFGYFEGACEEDRVELEWLTFSEINNDYFIIERSIDGSNFQVIGQVDGNGNSSNLNEYFFTDDNPKANLIYYRLKQVDFDGTTDYSKVLVIENCYTPPTSINVYPNPTVDRINIETSYQEESVDVNIVNLTGQIVLQNQIAKGENIKQIEVSALPAGTYIVLVGGDNPQSKKFIKQGASK